MKLWILASVLSVGLCQLLGGWIPQDPSNRKYQMMLDYLSTQKLAVVPNGFKLTTVRTQVVAGFNYMFTFENSGTTCEIVLFEQPLTGSHHVTHDTCAAYVAKQSKRMLLAVPGGYSAQDPKDPQWQTLLNDIENKYHLVDLGGANDVEIMDVSTQVVSGINTKFTLRLEGKTCTFVYYEQSWTNTREISSDTCGIKVMPSHVIPMPGGLNPQDPTDQKWMDMLIKLSSTYNLIQMPATTKIISVKQQVVAGINTYFTLDIGGSMCSLVYFSQSWTNTREITTDTCGIKVTSKRQLAGGWKTQDPRDQKYDDLLTLLSTNYSLIQLNGIHDLEILEVKTQVVSGMNYNFTLKVHNHVCNIIYYEQSWSNTHKITFDSCNIKMTNKRQLAGGWKTQDPRDQKYDDLLTLLNTNYSLIQLNGIHDLEILAVKTQVVSGMNYNFTLKVHNHVCNIIYYEQSWSNTHKITFDSCNIKMTNKRQLAGGWKTQDPRDQKYDDLLTLLNTNYSLIQLNGIHDLEILAVKTQVVSGMNYNFTLKVHNHVCNIIYYEQPWSNTHKITFDSCNIKMTSKRQLAGGWKTQDPRDQKYDDLLTLLNTNYSLIQLNGIHDLEILAVKTQVVNGMNYNFTLRVHNKILSECQTDGILMRRRVTRRLIWIQTVCIGNNRVASRVLKHVCNIIYYEQVWTNTHEITSDSCGIKVTHTRQLLAGGWTDQDVTNSQWMGKLQELEQKHMISLNGDNDMEILGLRTQVVAGKNYMFTLKVHDHVCMFDFFEQTWTSTLKITKDTCGITVTTHHVQKRVGGYTKQDATDPHWQNFLHELDAKYNLVHLDGASKPQVLGVQTQLVAGTNYKFTLSVNGKVCQMVYFEQLWTNTREITQDDCGIKVMAKSKRSSTSAAQHKCLGAILDRINSMSNSLFRLVDSHNIQTQIQSTNNVVSGEFRIQLAESSCINGADTAGYTSTDCPANPSSMMHTTWEAKCKYSTDGTPVEVSDLQMVSH